MASCLNRAELHWLKWKGSDVPFIGLPLRINSVNQIVGDVCPGMGSLDNLYSKYIEHPRSEHG